MRAVYHIHSIGSDTHRPGQVCGYFDESYALLKALGFRHFYTFDAMQPIGTRYDICTLL